jgi:hypothetical protein
MCKSVRDLPSCGGGRGETRSARRPTNRSRGSQPSPGAGGDGNPAVTPANAVIYTRRQEAAIPDAVDEQVRVCRQIAEQEGLRVIGTYQDVGSANAPLAARPGLCALLKDAEQHQFQTILVVADLDRLSRNNTGLVALVRKLSSLNVCLRTASGDCNWTTSTLVRSVFDEYLRGVLPAQRASRLNEVLR